jgi:hypothetical protein
MEADRGSISDETRRAERNDAKASHRADRMPTPEEEEEAGESVLDQKVAEHYKEMAERGARQEGEGRPR